MKKVESLDREMGLDSNDVQVCIRRILKFPMELCCFCVKKFPFISGIFLLFFLLYRFFPSVFRYAIYSTPVFVFIAVVIGVIFRRRRRVIKDVEEDEKKNDGISSQKPGLVEGDAIVTKNENSSIETLTARRRNVKEKSIEVFEQGSVVEKDMVFSTTCNDDLVDKTALVEENPKEIREVKVDRVVDLAESSTVASKRPRQRNRARSVERTHRFNVGGNEMEAESSEDGEDEEEEEEEEEAREERNKAVQWTEDDRKNLMDLGISEIERNRRLESLIAKRRARKLLSLQIRRTLMNLGNNDPHNQIASILIPKPSSFLPNDSHEARASPMPGSAPSVLLPMHNPFDLPYDPHEERPNLMGDSFSQEFMAPQQKEIVFCRHESFSLGSFFPGELRQDRENFWCRNFSASQSAPDLPEYCKLKNQSSSSQEDTMPHGGSAPDLARQEDQPSEKLINLIDTPQEEDRSETHNKSIIVKDVNGESTSSSSSEVNEPFFNANREKVLKSLAFSVPRNIPADREDNGRTDELIYDSSPSTFDRIRMEQRFFHPDDGPHHTPCHSIASDLQVEVSEVSSPPPTMDGNFSLSDGESLIVDLGKETIAGSEDMWVASSQLSGVEENESRSKEVNEVSEKDIIDVGFSRISQKSNDPIASHVLQEKVVQQDCSDEILSSSSRTKLSVGSQVYPTNLNSQTNEAQPFSTFNCSEILPPDNLTLLVLKKAQKSIDKLLSHLPNDSYSKKLEGPSYPPEKSAAEVSVVCSIKDPVCPANNEIDSSKSIKDTDSKAILIKQEAATELSVPTKKDDSKSFMTSERKFEGPENDRSKSSTEYLDEEFKKQTDEKHIVEKSKSTDDKDLQHGAGEQGIVEVRISSSNENSNDAVALTVLSEVVTKQVPTISSSSPALQEKVPIIAEKSKSTDDEDLQHGAGEQGIVEVRISSSNENSNDAVALAVQPEVVTKQGPTISSSSSALQEKVPINHASSTNFNEKIHENAQQFDTGMVDKNLMVEQLAKNSKPTLPQNALNLTVASVAYPSDSKDLEKSKELYNPPDKSVESNVICHANDSEVSLNKDRGKLSPKEKDIEAHILIKQEDAGNLSKPSQETSSKSPVNSEDQSSKPDKHQTILESEKPVEKNVYLKSIEDSESESKELAAQKDILDNSKPIEKTETQEPIQEREREQATVDTGFSGISHSFNDSIALAMLPELVVEQVPVPSSSSSSPTSVLQKKFSIDQTFLLNSDQDIQVDVNQSETMMVVNNYLSEQAPENLTLTAPLTVYSSAHLPGDRDSEKLQESSSLSMKPTEESNTIYTANGSAENRDKCKESLNSIEDINVELQTLRSDEAKAEPSKQAKEIDSNSKKLTEQDAPPAPSKGNSTEDIKLELQTLRSHEAKAELLKPAKETDSSSNKDTEIISKESTGQEAPTAQSKANTTEDIKGELQSLRSGEAGAEHSKPGKEADSAKETDSSSNKDTEIISKESTGQEAPTAQSKANTTKDIKGELQSLRSGVARAEHSKPGKEADSISDKPTKQETPTAPSKANSTEDIKGELQTLRSHEAKAELSKPAKETDSRSNKDTQSISKKATEQEALNGLSEANSTEDIKDELQTLRSHEAKSELLKPAIEIDSRSNKDTESISKIPPEQEALTASSKANSTEDIEGELQSFRSEEAKAEPSKPAKENDSVSNKPTEQEAAAVPSKANSTEDIEGELQSLRSEEAKAGPSKPVKENDSVSNKPTVQGAAIVPSKANSTEDTSELQNLRSEEAKAESSKPVTETDSVSNKPTAQEATIASSKANSTEDIKHEMQTLRSLEAKAELLKPAMETDSRSNKDIESISKKTTEPDAPTGPSKANSIEDSKGDLQTSDEAKAEPSKPAKETNSVSTKPIEQETATDPSKANSTEVMKGELQSLGSDEAKAEPSKPAKETDSVSNKPTEQEIATAPSKADSTEDIKGELQTLRSQEAKADLSKPVMDTGSKSNTDSESICKPLTEQVPTAPSKASSSEEIRDELQMLRGPESKAELSKSAMEADSRSNKDTKIISKKMTEQEAPTVPSKAAEQSDSSNILITKEEEPIHSPRKLIEEPTTISELNKLVVSEMYDKNLKSAAGDTECKFQTSNGSAVVEPSENARAVNSSSTEDVKGKSKKLTEVEGMKSVAGNTECEFQTSNGTAVVKPSENQEAADLSSTEDIKGKSDKLTKAKAIVDPSKLAEESGSSYNSVASIEIEGAIDPPMKPTGEANIISHANKSMVNQMDHMEDLKSVVGDTECESKRFVKSTNASKPSEGAEVVNSRSLEDINSRSTKLTEIEANDPSKPEGENDASVKPITFVEKEKPSHPPPGKHIEEASSISDMNTSLVSEITDEDLKSAVGDTECQSKRLSRPVTLPGSSENGEVVDSRSTEDIKGISKKPNEVNVVQDTLKPTEINHDSDNSRTSLEREEQINPPPIISNANKSAINEKDGKEDLKFIFRETEGESQILIKPVTIVKPSEVSEVGTTEDIEGKSSKLTEVEAMVGSGKKDNLNNTKDTEVSRKSTGPENAVDLAKPDEGNDSLADIEKKKVQSKDSIKDVVDLDKPVNHNTVTELPQQKESGEKAPNAGLSESDQKAA